MMLRDKYGVTIEERFEEMASGLEVDAVALLVFGVRWLVRLPIEGGRAHGFCAPWCDCSAGERGETRHRGLACRDS